MLEPSNQPRLSQRRFDRRKPAQQPIPLRRPQRQRQGFANGETDPGLRQAGDRAVSRPQRLLQTHPVVRRTLADVNPVRDSGTRFNLRHLLLGGSRPSGPSPQVSKGTSGRRIRPIPEGHRSTQSYPIPAKTSRAAVRLEPARPMMSLVEQPQRGLLRANPARRREQNPSNLGTVKPLKPHPVSQPALTQRPRQSQRRPSRAPSPLLYTTRLLILGVGVGAIAGTVLSVWNPATRTVAEPPQTAASTLTLNSKPGSSSSGQSFSRDVTPGNLTPSPNALRLGQEMTALATRIQALTAENPGLTPGVFLVDLDNGNYLNLNGTSIFASASMIKVPVLVAFLQDVDAGKIHLDERLTLQEKDIGSGSGEMQYQPVGTQISALETALKMITISDNTATNMLISRMGGIEALNQRFRSWGLANTVIRNPLPDLQGTNTTSPKELADLLTMVTQGDLLSLRSRDRLLDIMRQTVTNTLLPPGLGEGAVISHKTGSIDSLVGDTGVIDMPNGKRYIVTVMVQRPAEDERAQELIRQTSRLIYESLSQSSTSTAPKPPQTVGSTSSPEISPTLSPGTPTSPNSTPATQMTPVQPPSGSTTPAPSGLGVQ